MSYVRDRLTCCAEDDVEVLTLAVFCLDARLGESFDGTGDKIALWNSQHRPDSGQDGDVHCRRRVPRGSLGQA